MMAARHASRRSSFVLAACVALLAGRSASAASLSIQPGSLTVGVGQPFSLDMAASDVTDLFAFQFDIAFDPTMLSATSIVEGQFLPGAGTTAFTPGTIDPVLGLISITADTLFGAISGASGSGVLATVFLMPTAAGTSAVVLSGVILLDSSLLDIQTTLASGSVTVTPASQVPEPATISLVGVMLAIGLARRGRRLPRSAMSSRRKGLT